MPPAGECGVAADTVAGVINNYILKNGRMQKFTLGEHQGMLLTSKHENSIAYDTNLRYIRRRPGALHRPGDRGRGQPEVLHQRDQLAVGHRLRPAERPPGAAGHPLRPVLQRSGGAVLLHRTFPGKRSRSRPDIPAAAAELKADGAVKTYTWSPASRTGTRCSLPA